MPKSSKQKLKILYIAQMLLEESDDAHPIPMQVILSMLKHNGITSERKSIYNDISALNDFGLDVNYTKENGRGYYIGKRQFELAELKLLVDIVQASKFITGKKSRQLIKKIESLTGKSNAGKLQRQVVVTNRNKAVNENIYYSVDEIYSAMNADKKIRFIYFEWTPEKEMKPRKNGAYYEVSPWFLTWEDENYYLIAYDDKAGMMKHYRVDKMLELSKSRKVRRGRDIAEKFDLAAYSKKTFSMFAGTEVNVTLHCEDRLTGVCIDRFGTDVFMHKTTKNKVRIRADVAVSPQFFGWLAGLGTGIVIESPKQVKEAYANWIQDIGSLYP